MQDTRLERLEHTSIRSLDGSLTELRDEIYYMLTLYRYTEIKSSVFEKFVENAKGRASISTFSLN